jgi:hypothetical protein
MNALHIIRKFTFITLLSGAALIAPAAQAGDECAHAATAVATRDSAVASLGQMVVRAPRIVKMGVLVVTAKRETNATVANLGTMTVSAGRDALATIADLGYMTVTAPSQGAVIVAGHANSRSWD